MSKSGGRRDFAREQDLSSQPKEKSTAPHESITVLNGEAPREGSKPRPVSPRREREMREANGEYVLDYSI
jgi:hypothetical protein